MPTVILLDASLSMVRTIADKEKFDPTTSTNNHVVNRKQLAIAGICALLDHLSSNYKLEFVSLVTFSHTFNQLVPFTRDYNEIKSALSTYEDQNITDIEVGLEGAARVILNEWGVTPTSQVLLITEGRLGLSEHCLPSYLKRLKNPTKKLLFPFPFKCVLHVVCLSTITSHENFTEMISSYEQLLMLNNGAIKMYTPDKFLNVSAVKSLFKELAEENFKPHPCYLKCGNLRCHISVFPDFHKKTLDYYTFKFLNAISTSIWPELEICGFMNISDVASPPFLSKHLIFPALDPESSEDKEGAEKVPAFTVLLHGSLKVENMVAIVQISEAWFGMLYSHADSKKKSNLTLACFHTGLDALPWLGNFKKLGPMKEGEPSPYLDGKSPFPVPTSDCKSYSQNCVVWIHNAGLQGDIQKILRNARKLPEKQTQFYKEMNRLKKAVLAIGFYELFESLASLLDRERSLLPSHTHPSVGIQISYASKVLRSPQILDINQAIIPPQINLL
ncbi:hypothetical protein HELRODRAFT_104323 [Helobdella robusta]|uniref:Integrator complex subunit 14 n=1 Tax=Helobdella robusta TaxID=6412 RepID=T1EDL0_HELRO|nr:hypothetical protein HELRODRAFT_104323 [Helobdella robusta]ESN90910.1 hypothetical protein HELRODRAFT_104323 [Helobdella robusta]